MIGLNDRVMVVITIAFLIVGAATLGIFVNEVRENIGLPGGYYD